MASDRCPNCGRSSADCWLTAFPPQHFGTPSSGAMVTYQAHCLRATVARADKAEAELAAARADKAQAVEAAYFSGWGDGFANGCGQRDNGSRHTPFVSATDAWLASHACKALEATDGK